MTRGYVLRVFQVLAGLFATTVLVGGVTFFVLSVPLARELVAPRIVDVQEIPDDVDAHLRVPSGDAVIDVWVMEPEIATPEGSVDWVLVLHGISDHKASMGGLGRRFATRGTGAILADLRGHGRSSEVPLTYGVKERHDLSAVLDAMEASGYDLGEVGIYGPSYSGAIAIQAASVDPRFTRIVTVACFAEAERILSHRFAEGLDRFAFLVPHEWRRVMIRATGEAGGFDALAASPLDTIGRAEGRFLLVHSRADEVVAYGHATDLARACGDRCELMTLEGMTHLESLSNQPLREALHRFMTGTELSLVPPRPPEPTLSVSTTR
jgi:pimeloyl-ACP methyl ester carboxylesterase